MQGRQHPMRMHHPLPDRTAFDTSHPMTVLVLVTVTQNLLVEAVEAVRKSPQYILRRLHTDHLFRTVSAPRDVAGSHPVSVPYCT